MSAADDFLRLSDGIVAYLTDFTRDRLGDKAEALQDGWNKIAPVDTGLFRHSFRPWAGSEPSDYPSPAPFLPPLGRDAIDNVLKAWEPGVQFGFTDRQPYTGFLLEGGSRQNENLAEDLAALCAEVAGK